MQTQTEASYWNLRYAEGHGSGGTSRGPRMLQKVQWLSQLEGVGSISEIGCGDFHFGSRLIQEFPSATYAGFDISDIVIQENRRNYQQPRIRFYGSSESSQVPGADLLLCIDVLFHVARDEDAEEMLQFLSAGWSKYLALTAYEYDGLRSGHIHIRKFDPQIFGTPIRREVIEDDGQMVFYIFKK